MLKRYCKPLTCIIAAMFTCPAWASSDTDQARDEIRAAIRAMGGEDLLKSIHSLQYTALGQRNMLEQSVRPSHPWLQDYFQETVIRDFQDQRERISSAHGVYSPSAAAPTVLVEDGVAAQVVDGKIVAAKVSETAQDAEENLAFDPIRLLLAAVASPDLHTEADRQFHGYTHHVVGWTWKGLPVHLVLNGYTALPEQVEWTRAHPYSFLWSVWGDITTRLDFNVWLLSPDGLRYPRQWTYERNGDPDTDIALSSVTVNPAIDDLAMSIPADMQKAALAHPLAVDAWPLGYGGDAAASELEPGIVHIPGVWNTNLIRQPDGIVVLEGPISSAYSQKVLDEAKRRYPDLPVKAVITTSDSWPHIGGLREYVARGIPVYALDLNRPVLERLFASPHSLQPDALQLQPRQAVLNLIGKRTVLGSGPNRLELIPYRTETGERQMLVYFPQYRLLYTSDLFTPSTGDSPFDTTFTPEYMLESKQAVEREHLDVDGIFGMHYDLTPMKKVDDALQAFSRR